MDNLTINEGEREIKPILKRKISGNNLKSDLDFNLC